MTELNVSRETLERLEIYATLLRKWNQKINLVSPRSLNDLWTRHIVDSVQIFEQADCFSTWSDIGSGGGFPGLVCAILDHGSKNGGKFILVESDTRKCIFMKEVIRNTGIQCEVINDRIESVTPLQTDVLSARALTGLKGLLSYADLHLSKQGVALFPKGKNWEEEVREAREQWQFDMNVIKSVTDSQAVILRVEGIQRV
ncbi:MAG: 16S rRNA (guanine(527)-N(7))-methyltransferase RsmG [Heliomarina sp.]|uniref:16S rRNA (guanine(527)-N(7))-methyltransferase RsmG n=1 Tax=Heliomarina sp. TaxID=2917556 RepID=UPI004058B1CA